MNSVRIDNEGTTQACVSLKEDFNIQRKRDFSPSSYNKKFASLKPENMNNIKMMNS